MSIQDVDTNALLKDAAVLAKHDAAFRANFERYCMPKAGLRASLAWTLMVNVSDAKRPVPWTGEEMIAEVRRRHAEKAAR